MKRLFLSLIIIIISICFTALNIFASDFTDSINSIFCDGDVACCLELVWNFLSSPVALICASIVIGVILRLMKKA